jgi:hypothetical protein
MSVGKLSEFRQSDDFESWVGVFKNYLLANSVDKDDAAKGGK